MAKIKPINDKVLLKRLEAETKTKGGIVLPDNAREKPREGKIVAVGAGKLNKDGTRVKIQVKKGDRVLFSSYAGEAFKLGDQEMTLMREDDILAIIE